MCVLTVKTIVHKHKHKQVNNRTVYHAPSTAAHRQECPMRLAVL